MATEKMESRARNDENGDGVTYLAFHARAHDGRHGNSNRRPLVIEVAPSSGGTRDRRRDLADSVDVGFARESSPRHRPSRRPDKEPLAPINKVDGVDESSPGPGGDAGEGSLKEITSNNILRLFKPVRPKGLH
ncbi:uncharacterized protein A4U43_C10F15160 [Asparagus officinalis]|uniref:Uncharacterized protein n=1 Tax=Asparagus officinalis TaxID=4686 RepID=A0A5P1E685_ASPOF|nr:uncharacterized protein A4U43_C10F15160 [Asparagus officinalis]